MSVPPKEDEKLFNDNICIINEDDKSLFVPELISNMRTQIAIGSIYSFIRKYKFSKHTEINFTFYKTIRQIKSILVVLYSAISFLEKPFYCNDKLSIPIREKNIRCSENIAFIGTPTIDSTIVYKSTEGLFILSFLVIQSISVYQRYMINNVNKHYLICEGILFILLIISFFEILICLSLQVYPLISFVLKGFIIILLVRHLRFSWINNAQILYKTKTVFLLIFLNILTFGLIGKILFNKSEDFKTLVNSMYSLYVLLSTCNFPDVMLNTFEVSKLSVFYFGFYITVNLYILISLLKALFFSIYYDLYKDKLEKSVQEIDKEENVEIFKEESFSDLLFQLNKEIRFTHDEHEHLLSFLGLENEKIKFTQTFRTQIKQEQNMRSNILLNFINQKRVEIVITLIDFIQIYCLFMSIRDNEIALLLELIWCILFIFEFFIHYHYLGLMNLLKDEFIRCLCYLNNFLLFVCLLCIQYYYIINSTENFSILFQYIKPLVVLRSIRVFVFLNLFKEFKIIFLTLKSMKLIFVQLIINLFSFYFIFLSVTMIITGGNILKTSFINNREIPNNYFHINFNDFGSSFLSCFALTMINNLQILAKSLSYHAKETDGDKILNSYFATFYFFSTLLILNIFQTLILEMYLTLKAKHIISTTKQKKKVLKKIKESNEESGSSDFNSNSGNSEQSND